MKQTSIMMTNNFISYAHIVIYQPIMFNEYSVIQFKGRENECVIFLERDGEKVFLVGEAKLLNISSR